VTRYAYSDRAHPIANDAFIQSLSMPSLVGVSGHLTIDVFHNNTINITLPALVNATSINIDANLTE